MMDYCNQLTTRKEKWLGQIFENIFFDKIDIIPQFYLYKYRLDFYIPDLRIAIEYDERHHRRFLNSFLDETRERDIKYAFPEIKFVRILEYAEYQGLNRLIEEIIESISCVKHFDHIERKVAYYFFLSPVREENSLHVSFMSLQKCNDVSENAKDAILKSWIDRNWIIETDISQRNPVYQYTTEGRLNIEKLSLCYFLKPFTSRDNYLSYLKSNNLPNVRRYYKKGKTSGGTIFRSYYERL